MDGHRTTRFLPEMSGPVHPLGDVVSEWLVKSSPTRDSLTAFLNMKPKRKNTYAIWRKRGLTYKAIGAKFGVCWQAVQGSLNFKYKYKSTGTSKRGLQSQLK
jgi:hypothetical protein